MIEGTAFTTLSTFPDVKQRDVVFQRPIISQLFIESGYIYLTAGTGLKMGRKKKKTLQALSFYIYMYTLKNQDSFTRESRVMRLFIKNQATEEFKSPIAAEVEFLK